MTHAPTPESGDLPHRRVHYFHGFDPATVARYRRIFEAASARLSVRTDDLPEAAGWRVLRDGRVTEVQHCRYEDLVRAWQGGPLWKRVARGALTLVLYHRDGALRRMARLGPRNLGLAISPMLPLVLVPAGVIVAAVVQGHGMAGAVLALALSVAVLAVVMPALYLHVVMDLFAYMRVLAIGRGPVWDAFIDRVRMLAGSITPGLQETLLVGHSLGGIAAIHALDAVLDDWPADRPIGLLTLGSTHGTVLVQQGAGRDRLAKATGRIASDRRVFWVDVSSPRDAFCLPLLDPLCLIDAQPGMESPRVLSAQLARAPRIPGDRRTVFAAMRRHMGYLLAPVDGSGFDFADTISGAPNLARAVRNPRQLTAGADVAQVRSKRGKTRQPPPVRQRRKPGTSNRPRRRAGPLWRLLRWPVRIMLALPVVALVWVLSYRVIDPPGGIYMAHEAWRLGGVERTWRDMDEISPRLARSAMAGEDARFCEHYGFDFAAIQAALKNNERGGHTLGGSTITQQVAKNVFLWHQRSWLRKGLEAGFTILIELIWPKRRIMEVYLNTAEFAEGVFGAEAAAQHHFGRAAAALTSRQAARLAAVLPSPKKRNASKPSRLVQRRSVRLADGAATLERTGRAACLSR